jgi:hypothetical protein
MIFINGVDVDEYVRRMSAFGSADGRKLNR